jgi:hypothetical protein
MLVEQLESYTNSYQLIQRNVELKFQPQYSTVTLEVEINNTVQTVKLGWICYFVLNCFENLEDGGNSY